MIGHSKNRSICKLNTGVELQSLQMPTIFRYCGYGSVCQSFTACDVQPLQPQTVVGHRHHRPIRELVQARDIQGKQASVAIHEWLETQVCKFGTVGQGETLNALALGHADQRTIAH